jgi:DNA-binding FadR family transcriptional regulator
VRLVAREPDAADIARLRARLDANERALDDPVSFKRVDVEFHFELALLSGNPIFAALHQATVGWLTQQRTLSLCSRRSDIRGSDRFASSRPCAIRSETRRPAAVSTLSLTAPRG